MHVGKSSQKRAFFLRVFLTFCLHILPLWSFPNINCEHHYLGSHGGHSVTKTKLVSSIHVGSKCVFSTGLSIAFINSFIIRPCNLDNENKISFILFKIQRFKMHQYQLGSYFEVIQSDLPTAPLIWLMVIFLFSSPQLKKQFCVFLHRNLYSALSVKKAIWKLCLLTACPQDKQHSITRET